MNHDGVQNANGGHPTYLESLKTKDKRKKYGPSKLGVLNLNHIPTYLG